MKTFKDAVGRGWSIDINCWTIKLLRNAEIVNLSCPPGEAMARLGDLLADPVKTVEALWVLVQDAAAKPGITAEQFDAAMWGDAMESACRALTHELVEFQPGAEVRAALRALIAAGEQVQADALIVARDKIRLAQSEIEAEAEASPES